MILFKLHRGYAIATKVYFWGTVNQVSPMLGILNKGNVCRKRIELMYYYASMITDSLTESVYRKLQDRAFLRMLRHRTKFFE